MLGKGGEKGLESVVYVITAVIQKRFLSRENLEMIMYAYQYNPWDLQIFPMLWVQQDMLLQK